MIWGPLNSDLFFLKANLTLQEIVHKIALIRREVQATFSNHTGKSEYIYVICQHMKILGTNHLQHIKKFKEAIAIIIKGPNIKSTETSNKSKYYKLCL